MPSSVPSRSSSFATDILKLVTGTTFAQVVTILASPLLTRLYGLEAFGFLALFTSITSIIGVIACMRYELAIMLPKTDEEAANLLGLCLLCVAVVSGLTGLALVLWGRCPPLSPQGAQARLIPRSGFAVCLCWRVFLALSNRNSRAKYFGRFTVAWVTSSLVTTGTGSVTNIL
jgi:lipopolysaccharide exporter